MRNVFNYLQGEMKDSKYKAFVDQLGSQISIPFPPKRIISIVPSQTELLFDLGLDGEIVGITKFCVHPSGKVKSKTKVGGTKNLNLEKIKSLQPDLIIGNKEENEELHIKELMNDFPVWMSDIKTLDDAYEMMLAVGEMLDRREWAELLVEQIKFAVGSWQSKIENPRLPVGQGKLKIENGACAYLIWKDPMMTAGNDTFIHHMLNIAGFRNVFADKNRYPEITIEELKARSPQYILLSSEPFPFSQKHIEELQPEFPSANILLVDGEMFSWYGSRLLKAPKYFEELFKSISV